MPEAESRLTDWEYAEVCHSVLLPLGLHLRVPDGDHRGIALLRRRRTCAAKSGQELLCGLLPMMMQRKKITSVLQINHASVTLHFVGHDRSHDHEYHGDGGDDCCCGGVVAVDADQT